MPLPVTEVERELLHTRRVRYEGYKRADGLWDIEAHLTDIKNHDYHLKTGVRRAGQPVHEHVAAPDRRPQVQRSSMRPRRSEAVPYPGGCENDRAGVPEARRPESGARVSGRSANELLGGVRGCTHLTEMLAGMPTAAIQTFAGEMQEEQDDGSKPFQLDQCHALETSTETVRVWYPKWYRGEGGMKIHEYQGKEIFREVRRAGAARLSGVQRRRGGRGGEEARRPGLGRQGADPCRRPRQGRRRQGREVASTRWRSSPARSSACSSMTHQTGPEGQKVRRLLIEEGADIKKEYYVGMVADRAHAEGGADGLQRRRHGHRGGRRQARRRRSSRSFDRPGRRA